MTVRREYRLARLRPTGPSKFAGAALLNVLSPADWQIANDVEHIVFQNIESLRRAVAPDATAVVEVTTHSDSIEVVVGCDDDRWVTERARLRPRRPFGSSIECTLVRADEGAKPALWPALAAPRGEESWSATYEALSEVTQSIRLGVDDLVATLDAIAAGVVKATPFTIAAVNLVDADGDFEVVAVQGSDDVRDTLLGVVESAQRWQKLISDGSPWGRLRFLPHDAPLPSNSVMTTWVSPITDPPPVDGWNPLDALIAPLYAADGSCIGALSVDLAEGAPRPSAGHLEQLELFAEHAAAAIGRARSGQLR